MINSNIKKPVVLVLAGHDPCGGAGVQADIECIANAGCHAATVITSLTAQNTRQVADIIPQKSEAFQKQLELILDDMEITACKIGMIGNMELIDVIEKALSPLNIPIVLDPVMGSSTGQSFADEDIREKIMTLLLPITTVITPNADEARLLTSTSDLNTAAEIFLKSGAKSVLITGADEKTDNVTNTFYTDDNQTYEYHWQRLDGHFHGSGCTLSSRIAAMLALGNDIKLSIEEAQAYTWNSLSHGLQLGKGQAQPNRFFED